VKASSSLPVHNLNTGLNYSTIQGAIDAPETKKRDTIKVDAGTYYEHVVVQKSIDLVGEDRNTTIIDGDGTDTVVRMFAYQSSISNFTIQNADQISTEHMGRCIYGESAGDVNIENNILLNATVGIGFGNSYSVTINNNVISNTWLYGVDVGSQNDLLVNHNITISNNLIQDTNFGINFDGATRYSSITNNTVENCWCGIDLAPNYISRTVPTDNQIEGNTLSNNFAMNLFVSGASDRSQESYTNTFRNNNLTNGQSHNLVVWGYDVATFMQNIDSSNTVNDKKIYYLTESSNVEINPSNYADAGYLALVNVTEATVRNFDFTGNKDGLLVVGSSNVTLSNVTLGDSPHLPSIQSQTYPFNWGGLTLFESCNNTIEGCTFNNNTYGVALYHSNWNLFYHNSFINNDRDVISDYYSPFQNVSSGYLSTNSWDNSFEGNYWSDYLTKYPNATETDGSGVWNTPYVIGMNNTDHYPLMNPYNVVSEFPSFLILPLFFITTLLSALIYKKRRQKLDETPPFFRILRRNMLE
jgi:parallel beta-helix repeat protein